MKIHSAVLEEDKESVQKQMDVLGLSNIPDGVYHLKKASAKNPSPRGYEDTMDILVGVPQIVGSATHVSLYSSGKGRQYDWFRTSPIIAVRKIGKVYALETENSVYLLDPVN